jgi:oligogalacturonide lyase
MNTKSLCCPAVAFGAVLLFAASALASNVGRRFPSEMRVFVDKVTGVPVTALTTDPVANDAKIYQDHPQWTADNKYIIFRSNRGAPAPVPGTIGGAAQAFAINETTGEMIQLTDGPDTGTGSLNIARKSMKLYFFRGNGRSSASPAKLIELNLETLFADSEAGKMKPDGAYEREIMTLPLNLLEAGGFALDADEKVAYIGITRLDAIPGGKAPEIVGLAEGALRGTQATLAPRQNTAPATPATPSAARPPGQPIPPRPGGVRSIDLATGEIKKVVDTEFTMGHVQTNPWVPGEIVYCNETGGDAPQRMWTTMADGSKNRPLYVENPDDWVTHEAVITKDEVVFNLIGHQARLRTHATGIAVINLRNDQMRVYGQVDDQPPGARGTGGFWHSNGSPDGRWLVGDTFAGNVWLIDRRNGAMTLLTTDHKMRPDHTHPTFSTDSKRVLIQSGLLTDGKTLHLMTIAIPSYLQNGH